MIRCVLILLIVSGAGCEKAATSPQTANANESTPVVQGPLANSASPASTSYKKKRYEESIQGLSFTLDGIIAVTPFDQYDRGYSQQRMQDGYDFAQAGFALDALKAYCDAIRAAPDLAEPYNSLGLTLRLQNKPTEALAAFHSALIYDPQFTNARYNLAMTHWMMGERSSAMQQMLQVVEQQSDHALAYEKLAIWHYYASNDAAAWDFVHTAIDLDHTMPSQFMTLLRGRTPDPGR